jgi:HD-like signal output (HDOD) protein
LTLQLDWIILRISDTFSFAPTEINKNRLKIELLAKRDVMGIVQIDDLSAGMVLASDLKGSGGRMLLPEGVELQENHLKTLRAWGIVEVDVVVDEAEIATAAALTLDQQSLDQAREYVAPFFARTDSEHPAISQLLQIATQRTGQRLAADKQLPPFPWLAAEVVAEPQLPRDFWQKQPKQVETLLRGKIELASLPDVYTQIVEVMNSPRSSAADLAEMVSKDTSLSSRMLKLVNSAFYGFPSRIDSISRAVTLIGTNELTTMALGISVVNAFKDIPCSLMSMEGFWRHSIACGVFARLLAARKVGTSAEQMFIGGLLHDIGRMVMLKQIPVAYAEVIKQARLSQQTLATVEKELLGYDHMDVGSLLCKEWRFSKALEEMISCHHLPGRGRYELGCCIIHLADILTKVFYVGQAECGCVMISPLQDKVWDLLGLEAQQLAAIYQQAEQQIDEVIKLFLGADQ